MGGGGRGKGEKKQSRIINSIPNLNIGMLKERNESELRTKQRSKEKKRK